MLIPQLLALGCYGFLETDTGLCCYLEQGRLTPDELTTLRPRVENFLRLLEGAEFSGIREIPEENWNLEWERSIEPVEVGDTMVITPTWKSPRRPDGRIVIRIDPKMSFGTGHHETTRLCLRLLEQHVKGGETVLDVGTGTGVLAIAAVKLGAVSSVGIDNDEWSIMNAGENVRANGAEAAIRLLLVPIEKFHGGIFDLIVANITLNAISASLVFFADHLAEQGTLIVSGFLDADVPLMKEYLKRAGFEPGTQLSESAWCALSVRRSYKNTRQTP